MVLSLRNFIVLTLAFSLGLQPAFAVTPSSRTLQEIKDNFELMVPVRKGENFTELYYRIETRLSDTQKEEIARLNRKLKYPLAKLKSPEVKAKADEITFTEGGQNLTIKIQKNPAGDMFITANGREISEEVAVSPLKTYDFLVKVLAEKDKKGAWLWHLLMPPAQALNWGAIISGVAAVGMIGYMFYQKKQASIPACKKKSQTCCNINSVETQLSDGCCTEAGGVETGGAVCMPTLYVTPETSPASSETSSSSGVR